MNIVVFQNEDDRLYFAEYEKRDLIFSSGVESMEEAIKKVDAIMKQRGFKLFGNPQGLNTRRIRAGKTIVVKKFLTYRPDKHAGHH